ncbi:nitrite/sulfite reductase [Candidatus Methylacidithermus pantelleriae]|uniref:Sulfite reductase (Ferredoxin) n=1 Tax=Candidatus Methylacidithermus pantelleriae TaxID=2744239 RepID=A0A8J2BKK4_9BACT|nr:nitrite/sulfite reductase [Candidatus Methylacidithermus pantelleriae]CAF0696322.1 Sulfite reductase (Ferredoxin) [Candidatus Methylacidithermus pantelleriae]
MSDTAPLRARGNPTWDEVLRRNSVERYKQQKHGYDVIYDLERYGTIPYEEIPEEDILRMQWWGIYHDKPKVGYFMLRIKIPSGILTPQKLRVIGEISQEFANNTGELTTRQDIQLHWVRLSSVPTMFALLEQNRLTTAGACGDNMRNITSCPVAGIDPEELFDVRPTVEAFARFFYGNRQYGNLPRKHKHTIAACPYHCNAPEIHDIAWVGTIQDGQEGYACWVGGGLSATPRIAKPLGVFVPKDEALEVARALIDLWQEDLRYRVSRAKARFKFLIDDDGVEKTRQRLEERLGRKLPDLREVPVPKGRTDHMGIHPQKEKGLYYVGFPCFPGLMRGDQMVKIASLLEEFGGEFRITREQNFLLTGIPEPRVTEIVERVSQIGFPLQTHPMRATSIGCTGSPHCNYAVGETKMKLIEIVDHLEKRFGPGLGSIRIHLDGCPHACGQHWVGDLGLQGTTRTLPAGRVQAYDVIVRGGLGREAGIGKPILRRVPTQEVNQVVERLVGAWIARRTDGESLPGFFRRLSDEEIQAIAAGQELGSGQG